MASRAFPFYVAAKRDARTRQEGLCAVCARSLGHVEDFAHHVIPNQCGNRADPSHKWLRTVVNCVILCYECHERVHEDGKTRNGAVAPPEYFRWSHKKRQAHQAWAADLNKAANSIWNYVVSKAANTGEAP